MLIKTRLQGFFIRIRLQATVEKCIQIEDFAILEQIPAIIGQDKCYMVVVKYKVERIGTANSFKQGGLPEDKNILAR